MQQTKLSTSLMKPKQPECDALICETTKNMEVTRRPRKVDTAIKDKKIFSISGCYPVLRKCLQNRGWVEKTIFRKASDAHKLVDSEGNMRFMAKILFAVNPNFLWFPRSDAIKYDLLSEDQIINHFQNSKCFTTKAGLCTLLSSMRWFADVDPYSFVPRCYRLRQKDEQLEFIDDFIQTAARGILKWVSDSNIPAYPFDKPKPGQKQWILRRDEWLEAGKTTEKQSLKSDIILKAIKICETYLEKLEHKDIDQEQPKHKPPEFWKEFLRDYYRVIHDGATIENATLYATRCHRLLQILESMCPQIDIEGERNIWIIKPGAKSQGRGIICKKNLEDILSLLDKEPLIPRDDFCVIQKYIERPLLIYGTKFDVRQWFLVTDWNPLTIWFYKRCYLRFSSQLFSLDNLSRSVHLCNNAVQKYCKNSPKRHPNLPAENMWYDYQFKEYLQMTRARDAWDEVMLPGMKEIIINTMKSAQDTVVHRKNTFQLYGADFMFGENFKPWLIEINSSPALSKSTSVSSKLSTQVQEDLLRVVLDRKKDSRCDVGDFELLYKQPAIKIPNISKETMLVAGDAIKKPCLLEKRYTPRVIKHDCQSSSKPDNSAFKETKIKLEVSSNSKKMDILPRKIVLDDIKGGGKSLLEKRYTPGVIKYDCQSSSKPDDSVAYKETKIKLEVPSNSKKMDILPRKIVQDDIKGGGKSLLEKRYTPGIIKHDYPSSSKPDNSVAYKETKIKLEVPSNSKKMDILPRKIVLDDIKGGGKSIKAKDIVLPKKEDYSVPKLANLDYKQPTPPRKLQDHSKERFDLHPITKRILEKHLTVKDTVRKLDSEKPKPPPPPCLFCKGQTCTCHKPLKKTFKATEFPSDLWKRT